MPRKILQIWWKPVVTVQTVSKLIDEMSALVIKASQKNSMMNRGGRRRVSKEVVDNRRLPTLRAASPEMAL